MEDTIIQYNTAVLAKEKGFPVEDSMMTYHSDKVLHYNPAFVSRTWTKENGVPDNAIAIREKNLIKCHDKFTAPNQSILQKWLREVHNLHIDIRTNIFAEGKYFLYIMENKEPYHTKWNCNTYYDTYEQALEEGLYNALKLI